MIAVVAAGDAAHEDALEAGPEALKRHARQILGVIVKAGDMQLFKLRRTDRLDAQGDVLQIFFALLGRDDDLVQPRRSLLLLRKRYRHSGQHRGCERQPSQSGAYRP